MWLVPNAVPLTSRQIELERYPAGPVRATDFRVAEVPIRGPAAGQVLVRNTWTSVDPSLRLRLAPAGPSGYFGAFGLRAAMDGIMTVGDVLESRAPGFAPGDVVSHALGWRDYSVVTAGATALGGLGTLRRIDAARVPARSYLGALGGMGLTAYAGLFDAAGLRNGDVVWVSAAAGAVGSLAAQFAMLRGHRVIGSAGSDEKLRYLLGELGLHAAFNYNRGSIAHQLARCAPDGIDVYFDNVGGEHLVAALGALRRHGRVVLCGAVSSYDGAGGRLSADDLFQATAKELTLRGLRGSRHMHLMPRMQREVGMWLCSGRLRYRESIVEGLEHAPAALVAQLAGDTVGKTLVRVAAGSSSSTPAFTSASTAASVIPSS